MHRNADGKTITSPTLMWVKAVDQMLMVLHSSTKVSMGEIKMVSGTAQQHGSVYWKKAAEITLTHLNSNSSYVDQLQVNTSFFWSIPVSYTHLTLPTKRIV